MDPACLLILNIYFNSTEKYMRMFVLFYYCVCVCVCVYVCVCARAHVS